MKKILFISKFLFILILLLNLSMFLACGDDEDPVVDPDDKNPNNQVVEDQGGETTGLKVENFALNGVNETITFNYVMDVQNEVITKDLAKIQRLGYKVITNGKEASKEVVFKKSNNDVYVIELTDDFADSYNSDIKVTLYYVFLNEKGNEKIRYSTTEYIFNMYELAKNTKGVYAEKILALVEPNNIVRIDLIYDDIEFNVSAKELACAAEIVSLAGNTVNIKVSSGKTISENVRLYINDREVGEFEHKGTYLLCSTTTETITEVDIELDTKEYVVTNSANDLYELYVLEELGVSTIKVVIKLKNNNILAPLAIVTLNGEVVEFSEYEAGSYIVECADESVTLVDVDFDLDTFEVTSTSDKYTAAVSRSEDNDDIIVKVTANGENYFSKRISVVINDEVYDLNTLQFGEKEIIANIKDERIVAIVNVDFDLNTFIVTSTSDKYEAVVSRDTNSDDILVKIITKDENIFSKNVSVVINNMQYGLENLEFTNNEIKCIVNDDRVSKVYVTLNAENLDPEDYNATCESDAYTVSLATDKYYEYIYVTIKLNEGYEFSQDVKVYVNGKEVKAKTLTISENEILYTTADPNWTDIF